MVTPNFSKREAIKFGWRLMKQNFWFFVITLIVVWSINFVLHPWLHNSALKTLLYLTLGGLLAKIIHDVTRMGLIKISLKLYDNQVVEYNDLFSTLRFFISYFFGSLLYILIIVGGLILLIIPGIIWAIKFRFFGYLIIDKNLDPIEALKKSAQITDGSKWNLFLFGLMMLGINFLGALCLLIGLFATVPTTLLAQTFVYRTLLAQTENEDFRANNQSEFQK